MRRKIITIDENLCTGCGLCIPDCPEGALQIIDKKARLISDLFCDGLGACIGTCPEGAITVIEREAEPYDERAVMATIASQGEAVITAHLEHLIGHGETELYRLALDYLLEQEIPVPLHKTPREHHHKAVDSGNPFSGCPGVAARRIDHPPASKMSDAGGLPESELRQWPIQLKLLNPAHAFFDDAELLISADCVPFSYPAFHQVFLRGKILVIFCPKLDTDIDGYIAKLKEIFIHHQIRSITILHMEVPCCSGVSYVVKEALKQAEKSVPVMEKTITITGTVREE